MEKYPFPSDLIGLPPGHQEIKSIWLNRLPEVNGHFDSYLVNLAIETNVLEGIFLITETVCGS